VFCKGQNFIAVLSISKSSLTSHNLCYVVLLIILTSLSDVDQLKVIMRVTGTPPDELLERITNCQV